MDTLLLNPDLTVIRQYNLAPLIRSKLFSLGKTRTPIHVSIYQFEESTERAFNP